jgi:DNA polymerase-3 subunit delta
MAETTPVVYLLHGEDEYSIAQTLADMEKRLGDAATAEMNTTRLDGATYNLEQLLSVASAMPFLAKRRLVILSDSLSRITPEAAQKKFLAQLEKIPATTALIVVENRKLVSERERRNGKKHWLERWVEGRGERAWMKEYPLPKGAELSGRIQEMAKKSGGQITAEAASLLSTLVDGDPRLANQEIQKLLAYVNYSRTVEADDVQLLTADVGQGDVFVLVDALGNRDGRKALGMLHRLLEYQEYFAIFGMVVRQFRYLILAREILDEGGGKDEVVRGLKLYTNAWLAERLITQARRFMAQDLVRIYRRLLEVDVAVKSSQMTGDLALETLVASLTVE